MKKISLTIITVFFAIQIFAQNITADTTLANQYYTTAKNFLKSYELDSTLLYADKAQNLYVKHLSEKSLKNGDCLFTIGMVYYYASMYDEALKYWLKNLKIKSELLGEKNPRVAASYGNIAIIYSNKLEYDKALEYSLKSLEIQLELFGEKHAVVARSYNNIGLIYSTIVR